MTADAAFRTAPRVGRLDGFECPSTGTEQANRECCSAENAAMVGALIQERRSSSPRRLGAPGPSSVEIDTLMRAAAAAPDHQELTPWRFVLIPARRREVLAEAFREALLERDPGAPSGALDAAGEKALRSPCLLLAVARLSDSAPVPEVERLISLGCAIQNVLLVARAMGFGSGLTSGRALQSRAVRARFGVRPNELAVCFISVGTVAHAKKMRSRPSPETFFSVDGEM